MLRWAKEQCFGLSKVKEGLSCYLVTGPILGINTDKVLKSRLGYGCSLSPRCLFVLERS